MKTVIEGVLSGSLPWGLVGVGAALAICALIAGLPGLAFAVGIYLPLGSLTPIFVGGVVRRIVEWRRKGKPAESDPGVLGASGMIAGEGLAGVALAILVATGFQRREEPVIGGVLAVVLRIAIVLAVCWLLYRAGRDVAAEGSEAAEASPSAK
jgi:uncharacterized oligopeptide transporter (OPT) family protein